MLRGRFGNKENKMKKKETKKLYADLVVDFLVGKKVSHVFDLTGGMITFMEDAIRKKKGIECVPMHHEQGAGFAAEGYARRSQNFGVALATSGPGATNLITAIGSSYFDSIPTMFIVGQVHTESLKKNSNVRQEGFQETDIVEVVRTLTKYAVLVKDPRDLLYEIEKAFYIMKSGRFGSVLVDVPINIQRTEVIAGRSRHFFGSKEHLRMEKENKKFLKSIDTNKVSRLSSYLQKAKAPIVLVGNGVRLSGTTKELRDFVTKNNLPVVTSLMGIDSYSANSKNFVGYIGSNGNRDANIILANADLIIALGTRLDIRQTGSPQFFNPTATLVHVDIDKSSLNYTIQSHLSFETDLLTFFTACSSISTPSKPVWAIFISVIKKYFARPLLYSSSTVDPNTFFYEFSKKVPSNACISVDVGQNQMWCAQSWLLKKGQRILFNGGMGAMGFALPAATGAWFADKKAKSIVICGDGGLQINIQEMETVSRNKIPMLLCVLNNNSLGMVKEFQDLYFDKNYQSSVIGYGCPDLEKIAHAYNFEYVRIQGLSKNDDLLEQVLDKKVPVLVEVVIDLHAPLSPKIVYGHALDDQAPYLNVEQKEFLEKAKARLRASKV